MATLPVKMAITTKPLNVQEIANKRANTPLGQRSPYLHKSQISRYQWTKNYSSDRDSTPRFDLFYSPNYRIIIPGGMKWSGFESGYHHCPLAATWVKHMPPSKSIHGCQPICDASSQNRTRAIAEGCERSHICTIPTPLSREGSNTLSCSMLRKKFR